MRKTLTYNLPDVAPYINWIYFFHAWGFPPRFAAVSQIHARASRRTDWTHSFSNEDEQTRAAEALRLFNDAEQMLTELANYKTRARFGLFNAYSDGDDIVFSDPERGNASLRLPLLRQQNAAKPCLCLADFVRPFSTTESDKAGIFAAAADEAIEHLFEKENGAADDYKHLLAQTLADRLAEAAAEKMHEEVRKNYWGYAPDEHLPMQDLFLEKFSGIRPAVGYPSLPDQSANFLLASYLDFSPLGISLTENGAMRPHAAVSGLLLAHPQAHYFAVGKIGEDQLKSYAERRGADIETMRKFLAANL